MQLAGNQTDRRETDRGRLICFPWKIFVSFHRLFIHSTEESCILFPSFRTLCRPTGSGAGELNAAYFLIPKSQVTYLYEDFTFRQGLEKMLYHDYKAIPVLTRDGRYVGTVTEGDFLWKILDRDALRSVPVRNLEKLFIRDILRTDYPPVRITVSMGDLLEAAANQSFVPVEDDEGTFIGLITRRDIIRYFGEETQPRRKAV